MSFVNTETGCKNFNNNQITYQPSDYSTQLANLLPMVITKQKFQTYTILSFTIGSDQSGKITVDFILDQSDVYKPHNNPYSGVTLNFTETTFLLIFSIMLGNEIKLNDTQVMNPNFYNPSDSYNFTNCLLAEQGFYGRIQRNNSVSISSNAINQSSAINQSTGLTPVLYKTTVVRQNIIFNSNVMTTQCQNRCNPNNLAQIAIPAILVVAQSKLDGSDIGDIFIQICDEFLYYDQQPLKLTHDKCYVRSGDSENVKQTKLQQCCPYIVSVLKGRGKTALDKMTSIYNKVAKVIMISFYQFQINIITYSMVKYSLFRILYGVFNINYLLGQYNKQFLTDLSKSRFCNFVEFFSNPNQPSYKYNKFFKYSLDTHY